VVPAIDARFRTLATRAARGIGGKSSGGFGALVLAMRHPTLFSAVACHSGDAYFELSVLPDIAKTVRTLRKHGGVEGFLRYFDATLTRRPDDITTILLLALARICGWPQSLAIRHVTVIDATGAPHSLIGL